MFEPAELAGAGKVALIGQTVARELFGDNDPMDQTIRIKNVPVTIVGVLSRKGQNMTGNDQDDVIMVPLATAVLSLRTWTNATGIAIRRTLFITTMLLPTCSTLTS